MKVTKEQLDREVSRYVANYREMRNSSPSMYEECMWQYADMANGGRAHDGLDTFLRDQYYQGYPDEFFVLVLSGLGEFERYTSLAMGNA
jgi:hypothetical protein